MRIKLKQRKSTVGDCFVVALGGMSPFSYFFHRDNIVQEWTWLEEERDATGGGGGGDGDCLLKMDLHRNNGPRQANWDNEGEQQEAQRGVIDQEIALGCRSN